jgi:hypothetical protein
VSTARNITFALDQETLQEARVLAAERGLSVSALLRKELAVWSSVSAATPRRASQRVDVCDEVSL